MLPTQILFPNFMVFPLFCQPLYMKLCTGMYVRMNERFGVSPHRSLHHDHQWPTCVVSPPLFQPLTIQRFKRRVVRYLKGRVGSHLVPYSDVTSDEISNKLQPRNRIGYVRLIHLCLGSGIVCTGTDCKDKHILYAIVFACWHSQIQWQCETLKLIWKCLN
jgi:hypothetical protein